MAIAQTKQVGIFSRRDYSTVVADVVYMSYADQLYIDKWWIPGLAIGYEYKFVNHVADFLEGLETDKPCSSTFLEGLKAQKVCEAILKYAKSIK